MSLTSFMELDVFFSSYLSVNKLNDNLNSKIVKISTIMTRLYITCTFGLFGSCFPSRGILYTSGVGSKFKLGGGGGM